MKAKGTLAPIGLKIGDTVEIEFYSARMLHGPARVTAISPNRQNIRVRFPSASGDWNTAGETDLGAHLIARVITN